MIQKQNGLPQLSSTSFNLVLQLAITPSKELAQNTIIADQVAKKIAHFQFFSDADTLRLAIKRTSIDSSKGMLQKLGD